VEDSHGRKFLAALQDEAASERANAAGQFVFLLALAGGMWAGRLAGITDLGDLGKDFNLRGAATMFCGALLGMLLAWPLTLLWRWLLRHLQFHIYQNLTERDLLLLGLEPDHMDVLPLQAPAPGMPNVADGDRIPVRFVDRTRLLITRYAKCCKALRIPPYPTWAMALGWGVIILAVDGLLYVFLAVPHEQRPTLSLVLMIVGLVMLASTGIKTSQQVAVVGALLADFEEPGEHAALGDEPEDDG
jgi:hypothetical protein